MTVTVRLPVSARLVAMLRKQHDDRTPPLAVYTLREFGGYASLRIQRGSGAELSKSEAAHVRGVLAAHAVEPFA